MKQNISPPQQDAHHEHNSAVPILFGLFFFSGFTALLYQVVWQRLLGLFSGSDVRSVTIVVAAYLLGLGVGSWVGSIWSDRLSDRRAIQAYGFCNLGIAVFAVFSRFLFYDLLFLRWQFLAQSTALSLLIVFISLLIPTLLMGLGLPLVSKTVSRSVSRAAARIGLLYGINALGSGVGTLISGWYIVGTLGYEGTVYLGAALSALVGLVALSCAGSFAAVVPPQPTAATASLRPQSLSPWLAGWCLLVFASGFTAISLEILWFRILDTLLQSIAYTYAHLLGFILISNAIGSMVGAAALQYIRHPRQVFFQVQAGVIAYSLLSIWLISLYWQTHPTDLRTELGYIDLNQINASVLLKYAVLPFVLLVPPNFLLGFYFPLVQQAVQTDDRQIGRRVGLLQMANILGNTAGSLFTGLVLLTQLGTAGSLRLLAVLGLGFVLLSRINLKRARLAVAITIVLIFAVVLFPGNTRLWAAFHGIPPQQYFIAAEDSTGVAAVTEANQQGTLLASGQAQANFPYLQVHALLGTLPALMHPHPAHVMVIGLGSGGTAHTVGVNPATQQIDVVELLGDELRILRQYASTPVGQPLRFLFQDPRYRFTIGDGRRELEQSHRQFDIIEADAIYPWRSRAGMLYSYEFFQAVRSHLAPGGLFVEWNVGSGTEQTFHSAFPHVLQLAMSGELYVLIGSEQPIAFNRDELSARLDQPEVSTFLSHAGVNKAMIRQDIMAAGVQTYAQNKTTPPPPVNTDLFPRSEYYLNQPISSASK